LTTFALCCHSVVRAAMSSRSARWPLAVNAFQWNICCGRPARDGHATHEVTRSVTKAPHGLKPSDFWRRTAEIEDGCGFVFHTQNLLARCRRIPLTGQSIHSEAPVWLRVKVSPVTAPARDSRVIDVKRTPVSMTATTHNFREPTDFPKKALWAGFRSAE